MTIILNTILRLQHFSSQWKVADIIMVLKPVKAINNISSYRPIGHINVVVFRIYSMRGNLWAMIDSTPFAIRMQLVEIYLIPVLFYGCEIFANCDSHDRKLNMAYNNIARYIFLKGHRDHISHLVYQIFGVKFHNLLKIKCLILFHKIINTEQPEYL